MRRDAEKPGREILGIRSISDLTLSKKRIKHNLSEQFRAVRKASEDICQPLQTEIMWCNLSPTLAA